jgi:hypothetical protein
MIRCVVLHRKVIFNSPILRKAWGGPSNEIQFEHVLYIFRRRPGYVISRDPLDMKHLQGWGNMMSDRTVKVAHASCDRNLLNRLLVGCGAYTSHFPE